MNVRVEAGEPTGSVFTVYLECHGDFPVDHNAYSNSSFLKNEEK